jgi:hypothetical protein
MKSVLQIILTILLFLNIFILGRKCSPENTIEIVKTVTDTVTVTDTIRDTLLIPQITEIVRVEEVLLPIIEKDTVYVNVKIPITQKTYKTDDYEAIVEGYNPKLTSMKVYKQKEYITTTNTLQIKDNRKWDINVRTGFFLRKNDNKTIMTPNVSLGVNYKIYDNLYFDTRYVISDYNSVSINLQYNLIKF